MDSVLIPLTNDKSAVIDACDEELVSGYRWKAFRSSAGIWYVRAYLYDSATRKVTGILMHRLILDAPDGMDVDHIDRDGLNNCRSNIRLATRSQNLAHCRKRSNTSSPYRGVTWDKSKGKWQAQLTYQGGHIYLGRYDDPQDAARAYDAAAREYHGPFATLNFPWDT